MAKQATAEKRQRRERGSINPDDIISGAFELAEQVSIDNLSMPLLGKHLGVGVTSIYWYFRKKDDLLNAMTDRALRKYVFATPYVEATDWRETLRNHARSMRKTFMGNPILCDLILIRSALSPRAARLGVKEIEKAIQLDLPVVLGKPIPVLYIEMDGTGVPVVKKETVGRQGKTDGRPAHTREVKLGCVFTQTSYDKEGFPIRDPGSTTYTGAIETAEEFGKRI